MTYLQRAALAGFCSMHHVGESSGTWDTLAEGQQQARLVDFALGVLQFVRDHPSEAISAAARNLPMPDPMEMASRGHGTVPLPSLSSMTPEACFKRMVDAAIVDQSDHGDPPR